MASKISSFRHPPDAWQELVEHWADAAKHLPDGASEELHALEDKSHQQMVLKSLFSMAIDKAKNRALNPEDKETTDLLEEVWDIGTNIIYAYPTLTTYISLEEARKATSMTWTVQPGNFLFTAKKVGQIPVFLDCLEAGVGRYLKSQFRHERVDRLLALALTDAELSAYAESRLSKNPLTGRVPHDEAVASLGSGLFWLNRGKALLLTAIVIGVLVSFEVYNPSTPDLVILIGVPLTAGFWLLSTVFGLVLRAIYGERVRQPALKLIQLLDAVSTFHTEFSGPGPISVPYLRRRVEELRVQGVIWPGALWALLDDFERRNIAVL